MTGITQTIPNYYGGISEQPDQLKNPGQVKDSINGIPDITNGLYKRPGSKRIALIDADVGYTAWSATENVAVGDYRKATTNQTSGLVFEVTTDGGSTGGGEPTWPTTAGSTVTDGDITWTARYEGTWFNYYRDETEGSYVGLIAANGDVRVWRCSDGTLMTTAWGSTDSANETNLKAYLATTDTENIQTCTINDTTFVTNRSKAVRIATDTTTAKPHAHSAYLELLRTENGRQYGLNLYDSDTTTTVKRATRVTIKADNLDEALGSGTCPGIGTQVFGHAETQLATHTVTAGSVNAGTDVITITNHGFLDGDRIKYNSQGGANITWDDDGTTTDIADDATLYVRDRTDDTFKVASSNGGAALDLIGSGNSNQTFIGIEDKANLTFRITVLGQSISYPDNQNVNPSKTRCTYSRTVDLLHGGEGWETGNTCRVTLTEASDNTFVYTVKVVDHEEVSIKGTINSGVNGIVRPAPTPHDAQTATTVDQILGGITGELSGTGLTAEVIGNGIYLHGSSAFNVEVVAPDLMRVMQNEVNDVSKLPTQCKHGYIIKIANTQDSDDDDYYMKFVGQNSKSGPGSWVECAEPGIRKKYDNSTMPIRITRTGTTTFTVDRYSWQDRSIGDDNTNPIPRFVSIDSNHPDHTGSDTLRYINKILFFRNRLTFLSGEYVITSTQGDLNNFWRNSALTIANKDPIDIGSSSTLPSAFYDGVEIASGLLVFTTNAQYLLASDDTIFNPDTAKLRIVSSYNYNKLIPPISMGVTYGFVDNSNKYSRFVEVANVGREREATLVDQTKVVPKLLPKNSDLITNSRENGMVFIGKYGEKTVYGFKYLTVGEQRLQSAWFKWQFNEGIKFHFVENDVYYFVDRNNFLQQLNLIQADSDLSVTQDSDNFLIHIDNWTTVSEGTYSADTKLTTFTNQATWIPNVTGANTLVLVDTDASTTRVARYSPVTLTGNSPDDDFTVPGNWDFKKEWSVPGQIMVDQSTAPGFDIGSGNSITLTTSTSTPHNIKTGDPIRYIAGSSPVQINTGNLANGIYYAIDAGYNSIGAMIQLASSKANALAGTELNIIDEGAGTHKFQHLLSEFYIGYLYDYQIDFPKIYTTKQAGQSTVADVTASLVIHRLNLSLGQVGLYQTILTRVGKDTYTDTFESTPANQYDASDVPYLAETIKTIPVYDKTDNVDITLKSTHPSPCTLRSLSWEGDYSPKFYRRA